MKAPTVLFHRHFIHKHPLFRRVATGAGVHWKESVYYLWWEFLRRHEGYEKTCRDGDKSGYAALYADFGDVHSVDFKTWWSEGNRGAKLFAEPPIPITVTTITPAEAATLPADLDPSAMLLVAIPLRLPKRFIETRLEAILKAAHTRKPGQRLHTESAAKYPITKQFAVHSLNAIMAVYDLRRSEPDLALWEIAQRLRIGTTLSGSELEMKGTGAHTAKKQVMTSTISRMLKKAKSIIEGVGKGRFPEL
jgi:hypothetical protein